MASYYQRDMGQELFKWYRSKMSKIQDGTEQVLEEAGQRGEDLMKEYISTRGTAKSGKEGRIETGKMLRAVGHRVVGRGGSKQVRFGWVSGTREDYFQYQETGFEHNSGVSVEGMYALSDAAAIVLRDLEIDLKGTIRGA